MNNRNPFIPNMPTAQGGWGDPHHQIYTQNHSFNNGATNHVTSGGGSSSISSQSNVQMQIPFSAHQQVQQQLQGSHGQWYTTQTGGSASSITTIPLQATTGSIFWDDGQSSVNLNSSGVQVNYATYQNSNTSGGYQQQQQQQIISNQQNSANVVHQIVSQQQRVVPITLDASHFVHFPVNLSPPAGMVSIPLSLNTSRSSSSSSPGASSSMSPVSAPMSLSSRNTSTPMSTHSPSPEPLQLNMRSSNTSSHFGSSNNSRSSVSNVNSYSNFNSNSNTHNSNISRMSHQQTNSRVSVNQFVANNSPSPPAHHVNTPVSRNSRSPAAYSGNSPSHSNSLASTQNRTSAGGMLSMNSSSNSNKSHQPQSSGRNSPGFTINPPAYSPGFPSSLNTRFSPAAVQFLTSAAAASMNLTEATLRQQLALNAAASLTAQNFIVNANNNLRLQQQNQQQQHQVAPAAHMRSSVPVTALPFHTRIVEESSSSGSPSPPPPPPPPPKRKRGPAKKREPKKPVAINPMESVRPNFLPSFQQPSQNFQPQRHPLPPSQSPINRPSVISSAPQQQSNRLATPTSTATWNSQPQVSSVPLPTMNPFPLVPTPLPNSGQRMTRPPQPYMNRMNTTPTKSTSSQSNVGSSVITTGSPRTGNPMLSSTAEISPTKMFSSPSKSPTKPNNKFTSVLDYAMERAGIPSDPAGLQEDIDNSDVFREDEIMKLVGQIPDQTNELQMLNPLNELRSPEKPKTDVTSWEQDALKAASQSGLDDLQFELDRFYCPPSPPKAVAADSDPSAAASLPTADSTLITIGGVPITSQPATNSSAKKPTGTGASPLQPTQTKPKNPSPEKPETASGDNKKPVSDDDCEVILVKLSTKKRRLVRRVPNPKKPMQVGKGPPPKMGNPSIGNRPVPGRVPSQGAGRPAPQSRVEQSRVAPGPAKNQRITRSTPQSSTPSMRPALPNGRHISVAPSLSRVHILVDKIPDHTDQLDSKAKTTKGTARKKTGGTIPVPKIVRVEGGVIGKPEITVFNAPKVTKATARKSTAPLPKHKPVNKLYIPAKQTAGRSKRASGRRIDSDSEPETFAMPSIATSSRPRRGTKVSVKDDLTILSTGPSELVLPSVEERPPIKMTLSLTESKVVTTTGITKGGRGKSSKPASRAFESKKKKSGSPKSYSPPTSPVGTRKRVGLRPKSSSTKLIDGNESEEDLLIVEEYLADSDDSFDPEGERDEASSESESEPEPEDDEEIESFKKIVSVAEPEPEPPKNEPKTELQDDVETTVSPEKSPSPVMPETDDADFHNSPINDFADDSQALDDDEDQEMEMEVEPEPGPFTNDHLNQPDSESDKSHGWAAVLEDVEVPPNPESTVVEEKTVSSESEDEDEVIVEKTPEPKVFEMPKPQVIIKGTKEDAAKAVSDMRNALAQLSKFKIPFFGK